MAVFHGTKKGDDLTGTSGNDTFDMFKGGSDTVHAGDGDDRINMGASLDASDRIDGGDGRDTVVLRGDYSTGLTLSDDTVTNVEVLRLTKGFSYNLTLADGNVTQGAYLTLNAAALEAGHTFTLDGSKSNGHLTVIGGAGDDLLTGGKRADVFDLSTGGNDTAHGGTGNDVFSMGGALTSGDTIDGGTGNDTLELNGAYNYTFGAGQLTGIETLKLDGAHNYFLTTNNGNVAAGETLTVDASAVTAPISFNGSAELDGSFHFIVGAVGGGMTLVGGGGDDVFDLTGVTTSPLISLDARGGDDTFLFGANYNGLSTATPTGGNGGDDTIELDGDYTSLIFGTSVASIETFRFDGGHSYGNVAIQEYYEAPAVVTVDASAVGTLFHLTLNNSAFIVEVGAGGMDASAVSTVARDDTFIVGSKSALSASTLNAGNGQDTLELNGDFSSTLVLGTTTVVNFETVKLDAGHSYDLTSNDTTVAAGATLTVDGSALTGTSTLTFLGSNESDGHFAFIGGAYADSLTGGALSDTFDLTRSGTAIASGEGGDDSFTIASAGILQNGFIDGGADTDTLILDGNFSAHTTITTSHVANIEAVMLLDDGSNYDIAVGDGIATAMTVDAGAAGKLTFSGAGDTTTAFTITGSQFADTIAGGAKADTITGGLGADHLMGGGGADIFVYTSPDQSENVLYDTIADFAAGTDKFDLTTTVTQVYSASGSLDSGANFNSELAGLNIMHIGGATELTVTGGTLAGHVFLLVDGDGNATYDAGHDYVIDITGHTGTITTGDFI